MFKKGQNFNFSSIQTTEHEIDDPSSEEEMVQKPVVPNKKEKQKEIVVEKDDEVNIQLAKQFKGKTAIKRKEVHETNNELSDNKDKFKKIKLTDEILSTVDSFKAIVARGQKGHVLSEEDHKALVHKKYNDARKIDYHITLFRVKDKKKLPPKEKDHHTVQGPQWTPPSSVGFVMGAQSKGLRIWSATSPTEDDLVDEQGRPSILARESMTTIKHGWLARKPHAHEKFGNTDRAPVVVFTPPLSPIEVEVKELRSIMNVKAGWLALPLQLNKLIRLSTPIPKALSDILKKSKLTRDQVDDDLLKFVVKSKEVLKLVKEDNLSIAALNLALNVVSIDIVEELLEDQEVIELLSDGEAQFDELLEIYSSYIEEDDFQMTYIGEFSFKKLYSLITNYVREFESLFFYHKLNIHDIIDLYDTDYATFCIFSNDELQLFLQKHGQEIYFGEIKRIYYDNPDLFYALVIDDSNVLQHIEVREFIDCYEEAQSEIREIPKNDPDYGKRDAYDILRSRVTKDLNSSEYEEQFDESDVSEEYSDGEGSDNSIGSGTVMHEGDLYWNVYSKVAMKNILDLRLKGLEIDPKQAIAIYPSYVFREEAAQTFIQNLVAQIAAIDIGAECGNAAEPKLLIPVNLDGKHWVGMAVEFVTGKVIVTYMDSEGNSMPKSLKNGLKAELTRIYPNTGIEVTEKVVEQQNSNNCGLHVIENLIAAVAAEEARADQEYALALHSELYLQQYLLEEAGKAVQTNANTKASLESEKDMSVSKALNKQQVGPQSVESKGLYSYVEPQIQAVLGHEVGKAITDMAKKLLVSAGETLRMAMYVDLYEAPAVLHSVASSGMCAASSRTTYSPELREALSQYKVAHQSNANKQLASSLPFSSLLNVIGLTSCIG